MLDRIEKTMMKRVGLTFGTTDMLTVRRHVRKSDTGYHRADGTVVRARHLIAHYNALAIPPAWSDVKLASDLRLHLQAVGRDNAGRTQYRYHRNWVDVRDAVKWERLKNFGRALPSIRTVIQHDLEDGSDIARLVCAAALHLIDQTNMRPGNCAHTATSGTRGATTLLSHQVNIASRSIHLEYTAKGGKTVKKTVRDRRLARILHRFSRTGGRRLFDVSFGGQSFRLTASQLNAYLKQAAGREVSAKDFRTFEGSARAVEYLAGEDPDRTPYQRRRILSEMASEVSRHLHNTPQMARSSYVHPRVCSAWESGALPASLLKGRLRNGLDRRETALIRFIEQG